MVCPQFEHAKDAMAAVFTPDGRWALSVSDDGTARAWDWRSGKPVTPPLPIGGNPMSVVVAPDGRHAVVGGFGGTLTVLDLGDLVRADTDPDGLCLWAELLASQWLHERGGTVNPSATEWLDRWRAFAGHREAGRP